MKPTSQVPFLLKSALFALVFAGIAVAQVPEGPQSDAPTPATTPPPGPPRPAGNGKPITVPTGTRIGVILESGISTATSKVGDSVYFRTSFPITIENKVVIPVGSYLSGAVLESKRPGHVKGKGELRIRLNTLVFPNGYTVDMNAEPHSTDSGKVKTDEEGKMSSTSGKGKDAVTTVETVASTAGMGSIIGGLGTDSAKGAAIGAGIGGAAGLAAILLSRGPDVQLPRGSAVDLMLERDLQLDSEQIHYSNVGQSVPVITQPAQTN